MTKLKSKIGLKILVAFSIIIIELTFCLHFVARHWLSKFGEFAASINENNFIVQAYSFLSRISYENASRYDTVFHNIENLSRVLASQTALAIENADNKTSALNNLIPLMKQINMSVHGSMLSYVCTNSNVVLSYPCNKNISTESPFYQIADSKNNPSKKTKWTEVYYDTANKLTLTAITPIYNENGIFLGIVAMDMALENIINDIMNNNKHFIDNIKDSFTFLIDKKARLIAFPSSYLSVFGLDSNASPLSTGLLESTNPKVKEIAQNILKPNLRLNRVVLGENSFLITSCPMPSTEWYLGTVAPEYILFSSIKDTRNALKTASETMTKNFSIVSFAFIFFSSLLIIFILVRYLVTPLNNIVKAALRVKEGDFTTQLYKYRNDEIGFLASSFNEMVTELQKKRDFEKEHARTLEQKVEERTKEIKLKSQELEYALIRVQQEVETHKRIENALQQSEEKYRELVENANCIILRMDRSGYITFFNEYAQEYFGYSEHEIIGKHVSILFPETDSSGKDMLSLIIDICKYPAKYTYHEKENILKNGDRIWVGWSNKAIYDMNNIIIGVLSVGNDVTRRKKAEETLQEAKQTAELATRAKSEFLASMSHEIRTPMNAIVGMANLILKTQLTAEQKEFTETLRSSSDTLLNLINDILDLSKIEAGKLELEHVIFNFHENVSEIVNMLSIKAQEKGLVFAHTIYSNVPAFLKGDPIRIRQILINLIHNAIKFTEKGEVVLRVVKEKESEKSVYLKFSITDTGIGIPKNRMDRLFKSFSQLNSAMGRKYGGSGLGLAISKQLSEMMQGEIGVSSEENVGSTFWFTVLLEKVSESDGRQATKKTETNEDQKQLPKHIKEKVSILVAEDNEANQKLILAIMKYLGFNKPDIVENGNDVLNALKNKKYDIVLMDVHMPEMDGMEATREIRIIEAAKRKEVLASKEKNSKPFEPIPIIAMTANVLKGDREKCLLAGMDDYLAKPIQPRQLLDCIFRHVPHPDDTQGISAINDKTPQSANVENAENKIQAKEQASSPLQADTKTQKVQPEISKTETEKTNETEKINEKTNETEKTEAEFSNTSVFDYHAGNKRLEGYGNLFNDMVKTFIVEFSQYMEKIKKYYIQSETRQLRLFAHTIKGMAMNIEAHALKNAAFQLETAAQKTQMEQIPNLITLLEDEYQHFAQTAKMYMPLE